ncbi:hypothetical protein PMAYCL1PPCAC_05140, partial [Pristionchus mayeri]
LTRIFELAQRGLPSLSSRSISALSPDDTLYSLIESSDEADALCRATLNLVDAQKGKSQRDLSQIPDWESLPWPPLERLFSILFVDGECIDFSLRISVFRTFPLISTF